MGNVRRRVAVIGWLCAFAWSCATAAPLLEEVDLVVDPSVPATSVPQDNAGQSAASFTLDAAGAYTITVTDLNVPAALTALDVSVSTSAVEAAALGAPGTTASRTVTLAAGTYTVQTLATAASGSLGSFTVTVVPQGGGGAVFSDNWIVNPPSSPSSGESTLANTVTVTDAGSYQLTLTDLVFPSPLQSLQVIVLPHLGTMPVAGTPVNLGGALSNSATINLAAGAYDIFAFAQADSGTLKGLYSLKLAGGSSGTSLVLAVSSPVGMLTAASAVAIGAAGNVSLQLADPAFPAALSALQAIVTQGAAVLQSYSAAATKSFAVQASANVKVVDPVAQGDAQIFVTAAPNASSGIGAYALYATAGSTPLLDTAIPVLASGNLGYTFSTSLAAGGSYQLMLKDFQFPNSLMSLSALVVQQAAALATTMTTSASLVAQTGDITIVVFPTLASASDNALFGVALSATQSGDIAYESNQGVGASFSSRSLSISTAGNYLVSVADLGFPAILPSLDVIVTRGLSDVSKLYSGGGQAPFSGSLSFEATPGTYVVNVLAQADGTAHFGLYGLSADAAPPAPTVTLTASPNSVASGQTAVLTWSSTDATGCTASGGWSGAMSTSGKQSTSALTANTTYNLVCNGPGGSANASIMIAVSAAPSHGGGGALSDKAVLLLLLAVIWAQWRRSIVPRRHC